MNKATDRIKKEATDDILGVGCQFDGSALRVLAFQHLGNNVGKRNGSHACKAITFGLASVNLSTIFLNGCFSALEFGTTGETINRLIQVAVRYITHV